MVTAIVIGHDDGLSGTSHIATIQMRFLGLLANDNWASRLFGDVLNEFEGSDCWCVLILGSSMMKIERDRRTRYSCSGESPVFGLELHLLFLGIAPCGSKLR